MSVCVAFSRKKTGRKRKKGRVDSVESCVIKMSREPGIDKLVAHSNASSFKEGTKIIQPLVYVEINLNTEAKLDAQASGLKSTIDPYTDPNYVIKVEPKTPPHPSSYDEQVLPRNSPASVADTNCSVPGNSSPKNVQQASATSVEPAIKLEPVESLMQSPASTSLTSKPSEILNVSLSSTSQQSTTTSIIPSAQSHPQSYVTTFANDQMPVLTNPSLMPPHATNPSPVNPVLAMTAPAYAGQMMPVYVPIDYFYKMMAQQENSQFLKPFFPSESFAPHQPTDGVSPNLRPNSFCTDEITPYPETSNISEKDSFTENSGTDTRNNNSAPQHISKSPQRDLTVKQEPINDFPNREKINDDDDIMILEEIIDIEEFDLTTKANLDRDFLSKFPYEKITGNAVQLQKIKQEKTPEHSSAHSFPNTGPQRKVNVVMPQVSEIVTQTTTIKPIKNQPKVSIPISPNKIKQIEPQAYRQCARAELMSRIKKYPSIFKISTRDTKRLFQKFEKFF